MFGRTPADSNDSPRVISYVNIHLSPLRFLLRKDIINHKDINLISFFNDNTYFFILNIYSDSSHTALKYLKDTEVNINNVLIMTGDFNIRDWLWDPTFSHHSTISDDLFIIADLFNLLLFTATNSCPTRYSDMSGEANSVLDLMFLWNGLPELDSHHIFSENQLFSDHTPLSIEIPIIEEVFPSSKFTIPPNSNQEKAFIDKVILNFKTLNTNNMDDIIKLDLVVKQIGHIIHHAWKSNTKKSRISKHSKQWWSNECSQALNNYRNSRSLENWKNFKRVIKNVKRSYFDDKIQEIANKRKGPWELTSWINRQRLPTTKAIKHNGQLCLSPESLWDAMHSTFNTAQDHQTNIKILNEIDHKPTAQWAPFSKEELKQAITKCNNSSAPEPDKLLWRHLKIIIRQDKCLINIINVVNACINLGHWPDYFKYSSTIIIPKSNKPSYDHVKMFCPIVLLNTLGKLIEKVIAERIQFTVAKNNFIYPC